MDVGVRPLAQASESSSDDEARGLTPFPWKPL